MSRLTVFTVGTVMTARGKRLKYCEAVAAKRRCERYNAVIHLASLLCERYQGIFIFGNDGMSRVLHYYCQYGRATPSCYCC